MKMYTITFMPDNISITVPEDTKILEAERQAGIKQDAPCGGMGTCRKCTVTILKGDTPGPALACTTLIDCDMVVDVSNSAKNHNILTKGIERALTLAPAKPLSDTAIYMVAFDIGTTTVVGYLLNSLTGEEVAVSSLLNPQSQYGADVIMRANYVLEHDSETLAKCIRSALNEIIHSLCQKAKISPQDIYRVALVGNTCMQHLFLALPVDRLVTAPYEPGFYNSQVHKASEYQIRIHPDGELLILPNIGGFVGSDTIGCMIATDISHAKKMTLMIDIGTNGEIVMGNEKQLFACSTAAGPAFEGAKIECGMRGAEGAIDHVTIEDGKITYSIIGEGKALGFCGSGLLDMISILVKKGFVEDSGRLLPPNELPDTFTQSYADHLKKINNLWCFVLVSSQDSLNGNNIYISQKDIREVQLAKGAIAAGIELLSRDLGISINDVEQVWIAGAFGNYMDFHSACSIGLIPPILEDRILPIGNAAGEGSKIVLLNHEEFSHVDELHNHVTFVELANKEEFQDFFVDSLEFPV